MSIARPLLLVCTLLGVALGLYEGWRFAGGLVFLMAALLAGIGFAMWSLIGTARRERAEETKRGSHE